MTTVDDLELIRDAARAAGERALAVREAGLTTVSKSDGTPVTNADLEVDALLKDWLTRARPDYGWLSEETADDPSRLQRRRLFVVDPIDGTRAFLKGRPWWGVSIAVVEDGRPIAGVMRAPDVAETYEAVAGGGARLNGRPISASATASLEGCAMLGDKPMFVHPAWREPWPPMRIESRNSIAYRMCLVACGAFDAALALSSKAEWDLAAADLIASEAGCMVTTHKGGRLAYNRADPRAASLVCAGPALHRLILRRVEPIELAVPTQAN
ncbi:MAG: 3'(2'),5'-bisphosphate nucleotidase CysQ [Caulobacteraceae bacterium]|nr:3'(2'),5'-bisphosphate nucleotidase CysQ [Caulobacteraceae bacterium]